MQAQRKRPNVKWSVGAIVHDTGKGLDAHVFYAEKLDSYLERLLVAADAAAHRRPYKDITYRVANEWLCDLVRDGHREQIKLVELSTGLETKTKATRIKQEYARELAFRGVNLRAHDVPAGLDTLNASFEKAGFKLPTPEEASFSKVSALCQGPDPQGFLGGIIHFKGTGKIHDVTLALAGDLMRAIGYDFRTTEIGGRAWSLETDFDNPAKGNMSLVVDAMSCKDSFGHPELVFPTYVADLPWGEKTTSETQILTMAASVPAVLKTYQERLQGALKEELTPAVLSHRPGGTRPGQCLSDDQPMLLCADGGTWWPERRDGTSFLSAVRHAMRVPEETELDLGSHDRFAQPFNPEYRNFERPGTAPSRRNILCNRVLEIASEFAELADDDWGGDSMMLEDMLRFWAGEIEIPAMLDHAVGAPAAAIGRILENIPVPVDPVRFQIEILDADRVAARVFRTTPAPRQEPISERPQVATLVP